MTLRDEITAILRLSREKPAVSSEGGPGENHFITPSHWQHSHMPLLEFELCSGEGQLAVSGNALDHASIRADPRHC